ncbi:hypothetical protein AVEN_124865-1 [Araneus ventricosus]|uniref:Uncharacterized protein n=1 Tax=Araneus ventricosus TaxID=182803 RepID=A0A4Y2QYA7_ARAVE|nr:hypothetical protein AVEN_124865-1 [Araneus ventricosus]
MYDVTVYHAFSIYLVALEDCCFAFTSPSSHKHSSIASCCETQCDSIKLFGGQLLVVLFHKLIDIVLISPIEKRHSLSESFLKRNFLTQASEWEVEAEGPTVTSHNHR